MFRAFSILFLTFAAALVLWPSQASANKPTPVVTDLQPPWTCSQEYPVSQGNHGTTHNGWGRYAWDFATPEGTIITAPVSGEVRKVRDDSTRYGCDSRYAWDANYIVIAMENGYDVLLLHLDANSALVEVGDELSIGEPLAQVGNSGWVCGTHLHLQVQRRCSSWWCPSIPAEFGELSNPVRGAAMRSAPCQEPHGGDRASSTDGPFWRILSLILPRFPATPLP